MRRRKVAVTVAVFILVLAAGLALVQRDAAAGRVYTVAQVTTGLAQDPAAWLGRIVQVRGRAFIPIDHGAVTCCTALLVDPDAPAQHIDLVWRTVSPVLAALLRMPLVGMLVARHVGGVGVYRVLIIQAAMVVPASGLPQYYPYTNRTMTVIDDKAELVDGLD